jgi:hypothetical protein
VSCTESEYVACRITFYRESDGIVRSSMKVVEQSKLFKLSKALSIKKEASQIQFGQS